jgi:putative membrane protein
MMEVKLGEIAEKKAKSEEVKEFGSMMVEDHGEANEKLMQIAQEKNLNIPREMDKKHKTTVDKLSGKSGSEFDKAYMKEMVQDHKKDIAKFEKATKQLQDNELKSWADDTLRTLKEHQEKAQEIAKGMGIKVQEKQASMAD